MTNGNIAKPELVLFSSDSAFLEHLRQFSTGLPYIRYQSGYGPQVTRLAGLDAMWASLPAGVELFGANPPFPLHRAQVLRTPDPQVDRGLPKYGIVGVAIAREEKPTPESALRVVLSALLKAVAEFNARSSEQIVRIGIQPDDLGLGKLAPHEAFKIIREIYESTRSQALRAD